MHLVHMIILFCSLLRFSSSLSYLADVFRRLPCLGRGNMGNNSPYSWLAFETLMRYRPVWNVEIELRPMFLGGVMQASG